VGELRRLQLPEEENRKLKQLVADPEPRQTHPAGRAVQKCPDAWTTARAGRAVVQASHGVSERRSCLTLALTTMVLLAACNTVNGAGKDVTSAGSAISSASGENKK
jgi:predicted small secreted protein